MRSGALPACLLCAADVGAALTLYAGLHAWRWAALPREWVRRKQLRHGKCVCPDASFCAYSDA